VKGKKGGYREREVLSRKKGFGGVRIQKEKRAKLQEGELTLIDLGSKEKSVVFY